MKQGRGECSVKIERTLNSIVLVDDNMRIVPEVLNFTNHLTQQGKSINTIRSYIRDLKTYYEWMELEGLQVYAVKPRHMPSFIKYVDSKNVRGKVSAATLNRYLATLSTFYRYFEIVEGFIQEIDIKSTSKFKHNLYNKGYLRHVTKNWNGSVYSFFKRKNPKKADKKRILPDVAKQFYHTIEKRWLNNEKLRIRNKLIFRVLYETGMRIGELLHLRVTDYDYPDSFQKVGNIYLVHRDNDDGDRQLKTGERTIPVSTSLLKEIDDYIMYHRPFNKEVEYIFVSHSVGNEGEAPTRQAMGKFFSEVFEASGIKNVRITPHSLRHTHASNLQDLGVDINVIKERLGHSSLLTTSRYAKPSAETLTMAYERYLHSKKGSAF